MTLRTSNIFWILLLYAITEESISFSISRLCFNFPKNQDVASFIQSVSSTIRDSPKNLLDLASLTGADGSQLQPPIGGGGGDYFSGEFLNGANREWEKGLFAMPFIKKNDTTSSEFVTYLSAIEANRYGASRGATDRGVDAAVKKWWARNTLGSKGLLIYLFPALYSQIAVLRTAVPFFLDRLSQYLQPIYMGLSFLLLQKRGASIIQATLWSSVLIGGYFMLSDTYNAGSSWVPLQAKEDSYAVITGASGGIGVELARLLYLDGFNLILISRQGDLLEQLKAQLLREQAGVDFSDIKQGENAMSSTGGDGSSFPTDELPHMVPKTTLIGDQRSTVDSTFQVQDLKAKNVNKRAKVRSIASSTSYRAMGEYDRDYMYDENSRDFTDDMNKKDEVEVGDVSRSGKQLSTTRTIVTIPLDLTDSGSAVHVMSELKRMGIDDKVDVLVNNAGCAVRGPLMLSPLENLSDTLDLNVKATVLLTRLLAPRIARRGSGGRILFVGSLSSVGPGPSVAVYTATKAFLQSFAMSLRRELMSEGVFVTLALPGAIKDRDSSLGSTVGAEDALIFRGPGLSLSVEHTASDIYKGLKQGRDVVVPGLVNKLYTYFFSQVLPSAAVGAITQAAWSPAPKWMPFLKPLASDLLVLEEQRRQKRRIREQQKIDKEENQRLEKIRKREQKQSSMARSEGREDLGPESGITVSRGIDEDSLDGDDFSNPDGERGGSKSRSRSSGDALLAKSRQKKDKTKIFGSFRDSIQRKKDNMKRFFSNFTENLNLPSKDEILADGFEAPLNSRAQYKRNRTEEGENDLQRKLREAIENEKEVAKREVEQETKEGAKGKGKFFEKARANFSNWALSFWYKPVIDYSAIREWAAVPFRPKGQGIILDEEAEKLKREGITDDAEGKKGSGMLWERADQIDKDGDSRVAELSSGSNVSDYPAEDCDDDKDDNQAYTVPVDDVDVTTSSSNSFEGDGDASDSCPSSSSQFNGPSLKLTSASVPLDSFAADCEDAHTVCEGMGLGSGSGPLPPSFTLPPRILDRSSDSSSSSTFKPATSGQSVIHSSPNSALLNLLDDDASVLMQRHHVLISSGRSSPTIGAFECQIVQPIAVDPMSASVLRYLSGGLVGMEGSSEDKIDFDNDADVEVEWESGHDDCQHRPPPLSLFSSMEDLRSLDALESFLNVSSNDPFEGQVQVLDRSTRNRVGSAREQRGYSL